MAEWKQNELIVSIKNSVVNSIESITEIDSDHNLFGKYLMDFFLT